MCDLFCLTPDRRVRAEELTAWRSSWKGWEENEVSGFVIVASARFHSDYLLLSVFRKSNLRSVLDLRAWWLG